MSKTLSLFHIKEQTLSFKTLLLLGLTALSACGFKPLYQNTENKNIVSETAAVQISPVPDYIGRVFVQTLKNNLNPNNKEEDKKYQLDCSLSEKINNDQGILNDNTATRATMTISANCHLKQKSDGRSVFSKTVCAKSSYNILILPYSTVTSEEKTRQNLTKQVAQDMALYIAAVLKNED